MRNNFRSIFFILFLSGPVSFASTDPQILSKYLQSSHHLQLKKYFEKTYLKMNQISSAEQFPFQDYKIIFVRGFLTSLYQNFSQNSRLIGVPLPSGFVEAFFDQKSQLERLGLEAEITPKGSTEISTSASAKILADIIHRSSKKVILISHSKGSIDTLKTLVEYPEIRNKVSGWISIQAPHAGSPLIDCLLECTLVSQMAYLGLWGVGGQQASLQDMSHLKLKHYQLKHRKEIKKISEEFPILSVGSFTPLLHFSFQNQNPALSHLPYSSPLAHFQYSLRPSALLGLNRSIHFLGGGANDGVVPPLSSCLGETPCVIIENLDHAGPVMDFPPFQSFGKGPRILFTATLLHMLMEKI